MVHDSLDIAAWTAQLPMERLQAEARRRAIEEYMREYGRTPTEEQILFSLPSVQQVVGPYDIAVLEQLRGQLLNTLSFADPQPVDVFIYGRGEAPQRHLTKTAGLPYWPKEKPLPRDSSGTPMQFLLQVCFADSLDLTGPLPGDVLLVFVDAQRWHAGELDDPSAWYSDWQPLGLRDLVGEHDLPTSDLGLAPFYTAIYRTVDYLDDDDYFFDNDHASHLFSIEATKIGGRPHWVQGADERFARHRFLCSIGSNNPNPYAPWPYLNIQQPLDRYQEDTLIWEDTGSLYLFLTSEGDIRWTIQGY